MKISYTKNEQMICLRSVTGGNGMKDIRNFINDLIGDYGYKSFRDLCQGDKHELAALYIEEAGRSDEFCAITEPTHSDQTINLFKKALSTGLPDDNEAFLEAIKDNAVHYYASRMEEDFDDVMSERISEEMHENGYVQRQHADNGETYWVRRSA